MQGSEIEGEGAYKVPDWARILKEAVWHLWDTAFSICFYFLFYFAASKVFSNKANLVIGPTPPGTGVI